MDGNVCMILGQKNTKKKKYRQCIKLSTAHFFLEFFGKYFSVCISATH